MIEPAVAKQRKELEHTVKEQLRPHREGQTASNAEEKRESTGKGAHTGEEAELNGIVFHGRIADRTRN